MGGWEDTIYNLTPTTSPGKVVSNPEFSPSNLKMVPTIHYMAGKDCKGQSPTAYKIMYNLENLKTAVKTYSEKVNTYNSAQANLAEESRQFIAVVRDFMGIAGLSEIICGGLTVKADCYNWKDRKLTREILNDAYCVFNTIVENRTSCLDVAIHELTQVD